MMDGEAEADSLGLSEGLGLIEGLSLPNDGLTDGLSEALMEGETLE